MWEWFCIRTLKPMSAQATSCCCEYTTVDFAQELAVDILAHDALIDEGLQEDIRDYKGIPPIPFSIELLI